jgi:hypothetical protein
MRKSGKKPGVAITTLVYQHPAINFGGFIGKLVVQQGLSGQGNDMLVAKLTEASTMNHGKKRSVPQKQEERQW